MTLRDALCGCKILVPLLTASGEPEMKKELNLTDIVKPGSSKRLVGQGLPLTREPGQRGDLVVDFEVVFPDSLPQQVKQGIHALLPAQPAV